MSHYALAARDCPKIVLGENKILIKEQAVRASSQMDMGSVAWCWASWSIMCTRLFPWLFLPALDFTAEIVDFAKKKKKKKWWHSQLPNPIRSLNSTIIKTREKTQIITFEYLEPVNIWYSCLKKCLKRKKKLPASFFHPKAKWEATQLRLGKWQRLSSITSPSWS